MKKKFLGAIFALAVMVATGYGVNKSMQHDADLSDMALSNVEALAWFEGIDEDDKDEIDRGYPSKKTITVYTYDDEGNLIRTETYEEPCCASGKYGCEYTPC